MSEQGADGTATGEDTGRLRRGLASSADDVAGGDDGAHGKGGRRSTGGQQATGEAPAPETHTSKRSRRSRTCDAGVNRLHGGSWSFPPANRIVLMASSFEPVGAPCTLQQGAFVIPLTGEETKRPRLRRTSHVSRWQSPSWGGRDSRGQGGQRKPQQWPPSRWATWSLSPALPASPVSPASGTRLRHGVCREGQNPKPGIPQLGWQHPLLSHRVPPCAATAGKPKALCVSAGGARQSPSNVLALPL